MPNGNLRVTSNPKRKIVIVSRGDAIEETDIPPWGYTERRLQHPLDTLTIYPNKPLDDSVLAAKFDQYIANRHLRLHRNRVVKVQNGIQIFSEYNADFVETLKLQIPRESRAWMSDVRCWWVDEEWAEQGEAIYRLFYSEKPLDIIE